VTSRWGEKSRSQPYSVFEGRDKGELANILSFEKVVIAFRYQNSLLIRKSWILPPENIRSNSDPWVTLNKRQPLDLIPTQ
jgi:hypothetical protein